jgi:hypothetical protein
MTPEQIADRQRAITVYIEKFIEKEEGLDKTFCDSLFAAQQIVSVYQEYAETLIRPSINSGIIQNYKIIANTELAVLRVSPIVIPDDIKLEKNYNARLALDIALNILLEWNTLDEQKCEEVFRNDNEVKSFLNEHLQWLYLLKPIYYYPVFSNAQVWRLFYLLLKEKTRHP